MKQNLRTKSLWQKERKEKGRPCIWMQAGVITKKSCNHYYDCTTCKYDAAMGKNAAAGKHISWQDALRLRESQDRTCRHSLTGRTAHRVCPMNYNCYKCDFDQLLEDTLSQNSGHAAVEMKNIKGFKIPGGYYFHNGHTWASIDSGGFIRVGMDDFSFKVLGGPDGFELPLMGQELTCGTPGWAIKREHNASDVLSPVSGVITRVNPQVACSPQTSSQKPYEDGWLFTVHNSDLKGAVRPLMAGETKEEWLSEEVSVLEKMIEKITGPLATDGGVFMADVYGNLPTLGWNTLARTFLKV